MRLYDRDHIDPHVLLQRVSEIPEDAEVSWDEKPVWKDVVDEWGDHNFELQNADAVTIKVKLGDKEITLTSYDGLDSLLEALPYADRTKIEKLTETTLGKEIDPNNVVKVEPDDENTENDEDNEDNEDNPQPVWMIKPNIGRAGYSFAWINTLGNDEDSTGKAMILVYTAPKNVTQKIVYHDVAEHDPNKTVGDAVTLPGKVTSLYTKRVVFTDDLNKTINDHVPEGYKLTADYKYPGTIKVDDNFGLVDLVVPVEKNKPVTPPDHGGTDPEDPKDPEGPTDPVTPPTNPQDPSKDPEEKPTTPDKEKPTTPETTPEVPNEEPTDPNSPGVPAETPSNPAAPGQAADSALPGKGDAAKLPQTGEETNAGSLIGLLSLAVAGVLSLLAFRKKIR